MLPPDPVRLERGEIPQTPFRFLLFAVRRHQKLLLFTISLVSLSAAFTQGSSYLFKLIVDAVERENIELAFLLGLSYPVIIFLIQLLNRGASVSMSYVQTGIEQHVFNVLSRYVFKHSKTYFAEHFSGALLNKIHNVTSGASQFVGFFVWTLVDMAITFTVTFFLVARVSVVAGFIFVLLIAAVTLLNYKLSHRKRALSLATAEARSDLSGLSVDTFTNIEVGRLFARLRFEGRKLWDASEQVRKRTLTDWHYSEIMFAANAFLIFLAFSGMMYFVLGQWQQGEITTGDMVLVIVLMSQITSTLTFIGQSFQHAAKVIGEMEEGLHKLMLPHDITDLKEAAALVVEAGKIEFRNVAFQFPTRDMFADFSLTIQPGQRVGLVGPSGAGKSTLVSLLLRQYDIAAGEILIDGQNIAAVTQDSLREAIAVVPQEPLLFHRSIRENITYGQPDASDDELREVAMRAQALEFIESLPEGFETLVGERGVKLSGGQRQRIAIARAMLKDAPILVLDEATSALDSESEVLIQKALHHLMTEKTVIAIAHRLSTLREMDRIIVLEAGKVVEDGSHQALLQYGGSYAKLWQHQAGGFISEDKPLKPHEAADMNYGNEPPEASPHAI